jgi:hypothetical protein
MSDENKGYNGWSSYESWLVNLWMSNDQECHNFWLEIVKEVWENARPGKLDWQTRKQQAVYKLSKELREKHEESVPEEVSGVYTDLLNGALQEVDWQEIAEHWIADNIDPIELKNSEGEEEGRQE